MPDWQVIRSDQATVLNTLVRSLYSLLSQVPKKQLLLTFIRDCPYRGLPSSSAHRALTQKVLSALCQPLSTFVLHIHTIHITAISNLSPRVLSGSCPAECHTHRKLPPIQFPFPATAFRLHFMPLPRHSNPILTKPYPVLHRLTPRLCSRLKSYPDDSQEERSLKQYGHQ